MKKHIQFLSIFSFLTAYVLFLSAATYQSAENPGTLSVTGTSTVHDWEVKTSNITGTLSEKDGLLLSLEVTVPVETLKSDKDGLDKKMYNAMDQDKYETVTFVMTESVKDKEDESGATLLLTGNLTIMDTTQSVTFPVGVSLEKEDQVVVTGQYNLNMKDYGVSPPKAMLGMIKTAPEVTVGFKWVLDKVESTP